jgi:hypothetical protein
MLSAWGQPGYLIRCTARLIGWPGPGIIISVFNFTLRESGYPEYARMGLPVDIRYEPLHGNA